MKHCGSGVCLFHVWCLWGTSGEAFIKLPKCGRSLSFLAVNFTLPIFGGNKGALAIPF